MPEGSPPIFSAIWAVSRGGDDPGGAARVRLATLDPQAASSSQRATNVLRLIVAHERRYLVERLLDLCAAGIVVES